METLIPSPLREAIISYYDDAGPDYRYWSRGFNMHFGFGDLETLLQRERMLNRMTDEVYARLQLGELPEAHVGDFGCGVGAAMRRAASIKNSLKITGVTLVPWQQTKGEELAREACLQQQLSIQVEDYHKTSFPDASLDGVYAIESACYSPLNLHDTFFKEVYRVLKPGARFVIADGFLKHDESKLPNCTRKLYDGICQNWSLPGMMNINEVVKKLYTTGFTNVGTEDISWRVAPSVAHVPFVIARFMIEMLLKGEALSQQSINNLKGSFLALLLGLHRSSFAYYLVTAQR